MKEPSFGRRLGRFTTYSVGQQVWLAALSLAATPVLFHGLGPERYGLLAIVNLVVGQLAILEFGFGHATIRRVSRLGAAGDSRGVARTLHTSLWVFLVAAGVGVVVVLSSSGFLAERYFQISQPYRQEAVTVLRIGAAFLAVSLLGNLAGAVFQGLQRFGYLNISAGAAATLQILGSVVLVLLGFGVQAVVVWSLLLGLASLCVHWWWLTREEPEIALWGPPDRLAFREMARFGSLLMLAGVFTQVFLSGGPLVLGHYVVVSSLPFFTVPFGLYLRLSRMGFGMASALYPLVAEMDGLRDSPSMRRLFSSGTRILLVGGIVVMAPSILLASPFLSLWMGADFAERAAGVLEVLLATFAMSLVTVPAVELARGTGRAGLLVGYSGILAAVTVGGVALLAPALGLRGAAVAFFAAQLAGAVFILGMVGRADCRRIVSIPLAAFVLAAGGGVFLALGATSSTGGRALAAGAALAILLPLGLAWALDEAERATLLRVVRRP